MHNDHSDISQEEAIKKVGELIKDIKVTMLCTTSPDGHLHSRPMTTQQKEFDGTLWFVASRDSGLEHDIEYHNEVNLAYSNPSSNSYVSICGFARFVDDYEKKKEFWNPAYKAWFPEGIDDPKLTLLKVDTHHAQYWDSPSSVAYALNLVKSIVTGSKKELGDTQKVNLN